MSEARLAKVAATRALYQSFDQAMVSYLRCQVVAFEAPGTEAFELADKVIACMDKLPQSLQKQFSRRRAMAEDFMFVYGPLKQVSLPSPETVQRISDQVCCVGAYGPG